MKILSGMDCSRRSAGRELCEKINYMCFGNEQAGVGYCKIDQLMDM